MKIILSADRTCDITEEIRTQYNIETIPYHIILENKEYRDNVDIEPGDLYQAYWDRKVLPKTSAINVDEYIHYFEPWVKKGYAVIHFCLGSALTSSYQNCKLAAEELKNVYVLDSGNLSSAIGLQLMDCRKMIDDGMDAEELYTYFTKHTMRYHASFVLDTLEFMKAGGRCSSTTAFGANLLHIKPEIEVDNTCGAMKIGTKYRGNLERVLPKYVKDKLKQYPDIIKDKIFITHSGIDDTLITLVKNTINEVATFEKVYVSVASCTISCHCGPGTLGILFATESDSE